jgi:hypothetical protein
MGRLNARSLTVTIDGTDYTAEVTSAKITQEDAPSGEVSFDEAAAGGSKVYKLVIKGFQDPSADSLWDLMWTDAGTTVPVVLHPAGGATVDATHPKFTGSAIVAMPSDIIGGDASADSTVRWTSEATWEFTAKPVRSFS